MTIAWYIGMMGHIDPKKYPKAPELLWEKVKSGDYTMDQWKSLALSIADNADEHRD